MIREPMVHGSCENNINHLRRICIMTKDEVFGVVMEAQAMSEKDKQRARDMIERLSERFPDFATHRTIAHACAIYGLALSKVVAPEPRKRSKKNKESEVKLNE